MGGLVNPQYVLPYGHPCMCIMNSYHRILSSHAALCVPTDCQMHWVSVDTSIGASAVCSILCVATIFQSDHRTYTKHVYIECFSKLLRKWIWKWLSEHYDIWLLWKWSEWWNASQYKFSEANPHIHVGSCGHIPPHHGSFQVCKLLLRYAACSICTVYYV